MEDPYTLGPDPTPNEPRPSPSTAGAQSATRPALSTFQTLFFASMWCPTLLGVFIVLALQFSTSWTGLFLIPLTIYVFVKVGKWGWMKLTAQPFWAGFVAGLAGFVLLPVYVVAGVLSIVALDGVLSDPNTQEQLGRASEVIGYEGDLLGEDRSFVQTLSQWDTLLRNNSEEEARWSECFNELFVGASDTTEFERAMKRIRWKVRGADAESIAADAMIRVCSQHKQRPISGKLAAYYTTAISNAIKDAAKKHRRECPFTDPNDLNRAVTPNPTARRELEEVLCRLEPKDREVIELDLAGYTGREIADELKISHSAARKRLERAKEALEELVKLYK